MDVLSSMATIVGIQGRPDGGQCFAADVSHDDDGRRHADAGQGVRRSAPAWQDCRPFRRRGVWGPSSPATTCVPAAKEQIQSVGGKAVDLGVDRGNAEGKGGYARAMDEDFYRRQRAAMAKFLADSDVLITTASVPGQKAPVLVTAEMVAGMAPGSVIVDLAAERGGNCESTRPGETIDVGGVTVIGPINMASTVGAPCEPDVFAECRRFLGSSASAGFAECEYDRRDRPRDAGDPIGRSRSSRCARPSGFPCVVIGFRSMMAGRGGARGGIRALCRRRK